MAVQVPSGLTDDNDFIQLLNSIVQHLLAKRTPEQVWIIQIDNWFDHKWLRFSGNALKANWMFAGVPSSDFISNRLDTVKAPFFQSKITFPPFAPGRVLGQWSFLKSGDNYVEFPLTELPHGTEKTRSQLNLHRRIEDFGNSACLFWFSGNSLANGRGSLMVYDIRNSQVDCWFAEFQREQNWTLKRTKGISREAILALTEQPGGGGPLIASA